MIGTTLGKYRILERLGEGGMGAVYKARDELIDRIVAIKVLRPELTGNAQLLERFRAEAVALARLNHPRIAILHGLEQNGSELYMVMEFLPGVTIEKMIAQSGRLEWRRAVELTVDILSALDHAHDMGVVHRDIKPANVMVGQAGVKVMDFGIARITGRDRNTKVGHTVGTPVYMSPEQLRGEEVDGRADIYAVGGMLYEMVTGSVTFEGESDYDLMMKQLNEPPPRACAVVPELPTALDDAIQKSLAKRKEDRFNSAAAMLATLNAVLFGSDDAAVARARKPEPTGVKATRVIASDDSAERVPSAASSAASSAVSAGKTSALSALLAGLQGSDAPLHRDWRAWVAGASVLAAVWMLVPRSDGASTDPGRDLSQSAMTDSGAATVAALSASDPREAGKGTAVVAGAGTPEGLMQGAPLAPPSLPTNVAVADDDAAEPPVQSTQRPPASTATSGSASRTPATTQARPPGSATSSTTTTRTPPTSNTPPVRQGVSGGGGAATTGSGTAATSGNAAAASSGSATGTSTGAAAVPNQAAAQVAVEQFLGLLKARNADAFAAALTSSLLSDTFLAAIREGRVSAAVPTNISLGENGAVSFSTTLSWRTAFGANRRGTMRVSGSVVSSGGTWRLTRARLLEVPEVR